MSITPLKPTALLNFPKFKPYSSPPSLSPQCCLLCHTRSQVDDLKFVLHDTLDFSGIDTTNARDARKGFLSQIANLSQIERQMSISINRCVDLGRTALYIAAEDDFLISESSVPLPVDAFLEALDHLSLGYCSCYKLSFRNSPESFFNSLETYLYVNEGFRRSDAEDQLALYLPSVLMHRSGSAALLSLIYAEILKMLQLWGLIEFDCEIFFPRDTHALPRGYHKQQSKESDQPHIMTSQTLLEKMLRDLKEAVWPFQRNRSKSLFLRAAHAANSIDRSNSIEQSEHRSTLAGRHFGDMRRALSACERLILLNSDPKELRDYSILLYHCGFYEESLKYLKLYEETKISSLRKQSWDEFNEAEENVAAGQLMSRLNLISMERGWSKY